MGHRLCDSARERPHWPGSPEVPVETLIFRDLTSLGNWKARDSFKHDEPVGVAGVRETVHNDLRLTGVEGLAYPVAELIVGDGAPEP